MKTGFVVVSLIMFMASPTLAQAPKLSDACMAEVQKLCGSAKDREARRACMKKNRAKISDPCKTEIRARMQAYRAGEQNVGEQPKP